MKALCNLTALVLWAAVSVADQPALHSRNDEVRVGFSMGTFDGANKNDAQAAMKVWIKELGREDNLPIAEEPVILDGSQEILQALREKHVEAVALLATEYHDVREELDPRVFISGDDPDGLEEHYIVLVHSESGIHSLAELRGRSVVFWKSARMCLARPWMDVLLRNEGFASVDQYCNVTEETKLSKTVLSVFFHNIDACVVPRGGFATVTELNPQIGRQLKVLAFSEDGYVCAGFCFRRGYESPSRQKVEQALTRLSDTAAGRQLQTIFRFNKTVHLPVSCQNNVRALLDARQRFRDASGGVVFSLENNGEENR